MSGLAILGCTGSIGTQAIEVASYQGFDILGVSLSSRIEILEKELPKLTKLKYVGIKDAEKAKIFAYKHPEYEVISGEDCSLVIVRKCDIDTILNSLVGFSGFLPSYETLKLKKCLLLANKESLVTGGFLLKEALKQGGEIYPIDSEHVALAKLLKGHDRSEIKRMIITASGGSLRDWPLEKIAKATPEEVLKHPTWAMGHRITIDSATMVNKGFEFVEACYLFDWDINNISVLINDESRIHSALEFMDNSYLFEVGPSDMRIPISYALNKGKRVGYPYAKADFNAKCSLNFRPFENTRYPLFDLVLRTYRKGGVGLCYLNAVDEEVIFYFLKGKINFQEMINLITKLVENNCPKIESPKMEDLIQVDRIAREQVRKLFIN